MKALIKITFLFCTLFLSYILSAQSDCSTAYRVCDDATTGGNVSGYGMDDFYGATESGCLDGKGLPAVEVHSFWFRIKMDTSGQFGFNITPDTDGEDWDFAVYGPNNTSCGALGEPIRCDWSVVVNGSSGKVKTGVGNTSSDPDDGDHYDTWLNVNVGDEYLILVNQFEPNSTGVGGFEIEWTGDVFNTTSNPLDCSIKSDLGEDKNLCKSIDSSWLLSAKLVGVSEANVTYTWFADYGSGEVPISPQDPLAPWLYEVTLTGMYRVEVTNNTDPVNPETFTSDVIITFYNDPIIDTTTPLDPLVACEVANNEAVFDLTEVGDLIIGTQNNLDPNNVFVRYFGSENNAIFELVPFSDIYDITQFVSSNDTIWARIENNGGCFEIISFDLEVIDQPEIAQEPLPIIVCDVDRSGDEVVNLAEFNTDLITGNQTGMIVLYDDDTNDATRWKLPISDPTAYIADEGVQTVWAIIIPSANFSGGVITTNCPYVETFFEVTVSQTPIANPVTSLSQCDVDGVNDGFSTFSFTDQITEVLGTQDRNLFDVKFYKQPNFTDEIDLSSGDYTNSNPYNPETIYVKIINKNNSDCFDTTQFTIQVFPQAVLPTTIDPLVICDDTSDAAGSDTNGINKIDLTQQMDSVILSGQSNVTFTVNYFEDPMYNVPIPDYTAYENSVPGGQTIYAEVVNNFPNGTGCAVQTSFELQVVEIPVTLTSFDLVQCDTNGNDTIFNLNEADEFITYDNPDLTVRYFNTLALAENNNANDVLPNQISNSQDADNVVYARVKNQLDCYRIVPVNLIVSSTSFPANYIPQVLVTCDDDSTADGLHTFMLSEATAEIITLFINSGNTSNPVVTYYESEDDALLENNPINDSTPYINKTAYSTQIGDSMFQDIYVRVESSLDGGCYGVGPFVQLRVDLRPEFELDESDFICLNNLPKRIEVSNPKGAYTYEWFDAANNSLIISNDLFLEVNQGGVYSVIATSLDGCISFQKQIILTESDAAQITNLVVTDDQEYSTVTVTATGIGNYEFAIDNPQGPYQDSNVFNNITPGIHTVYVQDKNSCGLTFDDVYVLGYPRFFTPNFDSHNETWNVRGVDPSLFPESIVYIFDRYGKQIHKMTATDLGWNGTYNGKILPSTDYWFIAELIDTSGNIRKFQSHFSLIRK